MSLILSQFICIGGLISFVVSMQQQSKDKILIWQSVSFIMYAIQYFILGAFTGMTIYLLNVLRNVIIYFLEKKNKILKYVGIVFIMISIYITLIQYKNLYDILPACTAIINIIFIMQSNVIKLKIGQIIASSIWIIYDIISQAYIAGISEFIIIFSTFEWILKNNNKKTIFIILKDKIIYHKRKMDIKHKKTKLLGN